MTEETFQRYLKLAQHAYSFDETQSNLEGYIVFSTSKIHGLWTGFLERDPSQFYVVFRGTTKSDGKLALGLLAFTKRARACREQLDAITKALPKTVTTITFVGHSLGGSLAMELLNNCQCNSAFANIKMTAKAFNPGWVIAPRHYELADKTFFDSVTIYHIRGDPISKGILESKFFKAGRVRIFEPVMGLTTLQRHSLGSFGLDFLDLGAMPLLA